MATSFSIKVPCPHCGHQSALLTGRTLNVLSLYCTVCNHAWQESVAASIPDIPAPLDRSKPSKVSGRHH